LLGHNVLAQDLAIIRVAEPDAAGDETHVDVDRQGAINVRVLSSGRPLDADAERVAPVRSEAAAVDPRPGNTRVERHVVSVADLELRPDWRASVAPDADATTHPLGAVPRLWRWRIKLDPRIAPVIEAGHRQRLRRLDLYADLTPGAWRSDRHREAWGPSAKCGIDLRLVGGDLTGVLGHQVRAPMGRRRCANGLLASRALVVNSAGGELERRAFGRTLFCQPKRRPGRLARLYG